jgi:hypothetical protein
VEKTAARLFHFLLAITRSALAFAALPLRRAAANPDASRGALLARYVIEPPDGVTRVRYAALKASAQDMRALDTWITGAATRSPSSNRYCVQRSLGI